jgi:hypothetical protein
MDEILTFDQTQLLSSRHLLLRAPRRPDRFALHQIDQLSGARKGQPGKLAGTKTETSIPLTQPLGNREKIPMIPLSIFTDGALGGRSYLERFQLVAGIP